MEDKDNHFRAIDLDNEEIDSVELVKSIDIQSLDDVDTKRTLYNKEDILKLLSSTENHSDDKIDMEREKTDEYINKGLEKDITEIEVIDSSIKSDNFVNIEIEENPNPLTVENTLKIDKKILSDNLSAKRIYFNRVVNYYKTLETLEDDMDNILSKLQRYKQYLGEKDKISLRVKNKLEDRKSKVIENSIKPTFDTSEEIEDSVTEQISINDVEIVEDSNNSEEDNNSIILPLDISEEDILNISNHLTIYFNQLRRKVKEQTEIFPYVISAIIILSITFGLSYVWNLLIPSYNTFIINFNISFFFIILALLTIKVYFEYNKKKQFIISENELSKYLERFPEYFYEVEENNIPFESLKERRNYITLYGNSKKIKFKDIYGKNTSVLREIPRYSSNSNYYHQKYLKPSKAIYGNKSYKKLYKWLVGNNYNEDLIRYSYIYKKILVFTDYSSLHVKNYSEFT